ncbi:family 78 glycoside hydrolase catalytic domain [Ruania sp. N2-46]|uniref:alpha-L-rhamnosidase n=1 Tax=Occultella gossypii TaxID=2800820 RepID=A0ABS7S7L4_9MICO|nr:family 78 glycoside hydrolase catalytic domain [Occultella gossypii]
MVGLRAEQGEEGVVLDTGAPRLSWTVADAVAGWAYDSYEVQVLDGPSRVVRGTDGVLVPWPFEPLPSRERLCLRVRLGSGDPDEEGSAWTPWSEPVSLVVGLLEETDWSAEFVSPVTLGGLDDGAPHVFTDFTLESAPVRATLYLTSHGVYEAYLNDDRIGRDVLTPGWTAYERRLRYQAHDVTGLLRPGANTVGALLGNGWYRGQLVWPGNRSSYGDRLALLAQLELEFADGTRRVIGTDPTWRACPSPILFDDLYDGERRDLRRSMRPHEYASEPVEAVPGDMSRLVARRGPAVRVIERRPALSLLTSAAGATIVDFGQNLVGWVELTVRAAAGTEVTVRHAEVLENGELALRPLRSAKATCRYVLAGVAEEVLRPTFTFNGFRYAEITGLESLRIEDVSALVLGSDLRRTGWLETSDPDLNRLHENVVWGMRGNFLDVPTDCPQRDERLGWTGDIQVFAPTANFLFDTSGFLAGWLEDLAAEQKPDGGVPHIIPDVLRDVDPAAAAWSDAAVIVPSTLYTTYADHGVLVRQYASMRAWVEKVRSLTGPGHLWTTGPQFGDWLDPTAPPDRPDAAQADPAVIATAYHARTTRLLALAAATVGHGEDATRYGALADAIAAAFDAEYVDPDGRVRSDCQTVYALALCWDLIADEDARDLAGERLAELVIGARYRVATGFVGTPVILDALCRAGRADLAHRMLTETDLPSWLYAVGMGATTIWERWDSMLPDGTVNPGSMTSFNHYAYGAVADWMHRFIGGLAPAAPGWREVVVRPVIGGSLTHASAAFDSVHGPISTSWRRDDRGAVRLSVDVPYGVGAQVWVPGHPEPVHVGAGRHEFEGTALLP